MVTYILVIRFDFIHNFPYQHHYLLYFECFNVSMLKRSQLKFASKWKDKSLTWSCF